MQGKSSISTNILTHPIILRPSPTILTYLPAVKTHKFNIHLSNIIFSQRCSSRYSKLSAPVSSLVQDEMFDLPLVCYAWYCLGVFYEESRPAFKDSFQVCLWPHPSNLCYFLSLNKDTNNIFQILLKEKSWPACNFKDNIFPSIMFLSQFLKPMNSRVYPLHCRSLKPKISLCYRWLHCLAFTTLGQS